MAAGHGVVLVSNGSLNGSASVGVSFVGARACLLINATAYGSAVNLQVQGPSGAWINVNSTTYSADAIQTYDLPTGLYRINSTGSTTGLYASLVSVPY